MRALIKGKVKLLAFTSIIMLLVLSLVSVALADDISNNLDASIDAVAEVMALNAGGNNGTTQLYVSPTKDDGKPGCNLTGDTVLGLSVSSSDTNVATVSPSSITFTSCGDTPTLTVTPHNQGVATISVTQVLNTTKDTTFNLAPATFTVNVAPPPPSNTAPIVIISGVTGGASYEIGSVPAATCEVTDAEDGNSSPAANLSAISGDKAGYGLGEQTASCSYTDAGGITASASVTYGIVDTHAPVITFSGRTPANETGWNNGNVTVTWSCSDSGSGVVADPVIATVSTEGANQSVIGTCEDHVGNKASDTQSGINIDTTAPVITDLGPTATPDGANGWYISAVENKFEAGDALSGFSGHSNPYQWLVSTGSAEGTSIVVSSGTVTDLAGNTAIAKDSALFKIDMTKPTITAVASTNPNPAGWYQNDVTVHFTCADTLSGIPTNACPADQILSDEGQAVQSTAKTVMDAAGNVSASSNVIKVNIDKTAPVIKDLGVTAALNGNNGWYKSAVTNTFEANDDLSGFSGPTKSYQWSVSTGSIEGTAVKVSSGTVTDLAGNVAASTDSAAFKIDLTDPTNVTFAGGPADGASYYFGYVPAEPTCTAEDAISGLAGCAVTGYSPVVGTHTLTATATDNAGRTSTATKSYTVLAWTLKGFYQPVDMNSTLNVVKGGSTVPLKFEVFAGPTELTDPAAIRSFVQTKIVCDGSQPQDDLEFTTTGSTSLRYDATAGQFIQNWQTPKLPGQCYKVTMTTQDGSSLTAFFKLK